MTAETAVKGLITTREAHSDLVLLGLGLPDFDGSDVARRVRHSHDVPVIVLTAMDLKLQLVSIGANEYITKPFNSDELLARVEVQFCKQDGPEARKIGLLELKPNE